jgi:hypothetical protein
MHLRYSFQEAVLWDGKVQVLDEKGLVGVFINIVIFAFIIFSKHNA